MSYDRPSPGYGPTMYVILAGVMVPPALALAAGAACLAATWSWW